MNPWALSTQEGTVVHTAVWHQVPPWWPGHSCGPGGSQFSLFQEPPSLEGSSITQGYAPSPYPMHHFGVQRLSLLASRDTLKAYPSFRVHLGLVWGHYCCCMASQHPSANPSSFYLLQVSRAHLSGPSAGNAHLRVCFPGNLTHWIFEKYRNKQTNKPENKNTKAPGFVHLCTVFKGCLTWTTPPPCTTQS